MLIRGEIEGKPCVAYYETVVGEMEIPLGIEGSFAVQALVGHQVGHVPEDVPADFTLVDQVAFALQDAAHLQGRRGDLGEIGI